MATSSALASGFLTSADWGIFNNKISSTSISAYTPLAYNSTTGQFTMATSSALASGFLTSADWGIFNNKMGSSTITSLSANYLAKWDGAKFINSLTYDDGTNAGIGTTTPWARFSLGTHNLAIASPSFVIASSSTGVATSTQFIVVNGNVGIGTSSPYAMLSVAGQAVFNYLTATGTATSTFTGGIQTAALNITGTATSTFANGIWLSNGCFRGADGNCITNGGSTGASTLAGQIPYYATASSNTLTATSSLFIATNQNIGIGTTTPGALLSLAGSANGLTPLLLISSSTAGFATSTVFAIDSNGIIKTGVWQGSAINVAFGGTGSTTLGGILKGNGTGMVASAILGTDYINASYLSAYTPLAYNSTTGQFTMATSSALASGFLTSADWGIFNKIGRASWRERVWTTV
jgi:hypothetical protein